MSESDPKNDANGGAEPQRKPRRGKRKRSPSQPKGEPDRLAAKPAKAERRAKAPAKPKAPDEREAASAGVDEGSPDEAAAEVAVLPVGNPPQVVRGLATMALGVIPAFCLMATDAQYRYGVPLGALSLVVAALGILDLLGSFDDPEDRVAGRATLWELARPLGVMLAGAFALWLFISLAVDGRLFPWAPIAGAAVAIPAAFLTTIAGGYWVAVQMGIVDNVHRPLLGRHGFWLIVLATILNLPTLGSHSLHDPWETHYGEVAREMLARNDWISAWWAQDGWFWSKPVLDFWVQALAMATFGVRYRANEMLSAFTEGRVPWPEWAVRLPIFLLTIVAVYLLYKAVANVYGRRAGLLGGVVLITMPQWFLFTHQTMTDMPFVAAMAAAMALLLLGAHADPDEEVKVYEVDLGVISVRVSAYHLVLGAILMCALPQILYLVSRNATLDTRGFHIHADAFSTGSPGNCDLPGNDSCHPAQPAMPGLQPALQGAIWAQAIALVLYMNWGERRRQRLFFLAAWLFCAISTMAKGPAGLLLPAISVLAYIAVSRRWRDLLRLEITSGSLILLGLALPWFVAMYARHGQPFTDRLIFHDMFKRAFTHVHDTNDGDDVSFRYYVWQFGYATFPWTGLLPPALALWLARRREDDRQGDAAVFLSMWFAFAFSLFSLMLTKFHHYILPAVPPAAMLAGIVLDRMLCRSSLAPKPKATDPIVGRRQDPALYVTGLALGVLSALYGAARVFALVRGTPSIGAASMASAVGILVLGVAAVGTTILVFGSKAPQLQRAADGAGGPFAEALEEPETVSPEPSYLVRFRETQLGAAGIAGAFLVLAIGRDYSVNYDGWFSQIRLVHLITYNYRRPWPTSLDFTSTLWAFTAVGVVLMGALAVARIRTHVAAALVLFGLAFGFWGIDVYMQQISPHWGQRETMLAYLEATRQYPGPIVAYQMNWKGENFYTGNHVPAFVSSGKKFQDYLIDEKKKGVRTFYFITEHGRTATLQNEVGATKSFDKLTTPEQNNKFVLVRARLGE